MTEDQAYLVCEAFAEFVLPRLLLAEHIDNLALTLAQLASEAPRDSLATVMYLHVDLSDRIVALARGAVDLIYENDLTEMVENYSHIHDCLSKWNVKYASLLHPYAFLVPVPQKAVPLTSMVSHALQRLPLLKIQLDALSHL